MAIKILPDGRKIVGIIYPEQKPKKTKRDVPEDTEKEKG